VGVEVLRNQVLLEMFLETEATEKHLLFLVQVHLMLAVAVAAHQLHLLDREERVVVVLVLLVL
jgi:hypothetical protein